LAPGVSRTRELISTLELCHHKAERWVANIVSAIASGDTAKGLGTRPAGAAHPVERTWKSACAVLSGWCAGCPVGSVDLSVGDRPASEPPEGVAGPPDHRTDPRAHRLARFSPRGGWGLRTSAGGRQRIRINAARGLPRAIP
jgi:hypothetical protein